jgi:rhamnosyltransferase
MIYAGRAVKAGYAIYYASKARVVHSHNYSGLTQFHRNFDMAVSQADHPEIFQMAPSENEGIRLVKSTAGFLVKQKKPWLIVPLIWQSGCKYLGYLLGKNYKKLPMSLVRAFSMQKSYWDK